MIVYEKDEQRQADLVDEQALKRDNDKYRFLLTVINVVSKYAWVVFQRQNGEKPGRRF